MYLLLRRRTGEVLETTAQSVRPDPVDGEEAREPV
jgi:hypothetical protein